MDGITVLHLYIPSIYFIQLLKSIIRDMETFMVRILYFLYRSQQLCTQWGKTKSIQYFHYVSGSVAI